MVDRISLAWTTKGFMPEDEGEALLTAASASPSGNMVEIGSYCGRSTVLLGEAAERTGSRLFTIDHHLGSEEHQKGEEYFDPDLFDEDLASPDSLPWLARTLREAALERTVTILIGRSATIARYWSEPLSFVFIDGGHSHDAARADLAGWEPHLKTGGFLAIHDVFPNPADGGRPPFEIYEEALASGGFVETMSAGSLRVLKKI